jgi:hypothetical protein
MLVPASRQVYVLPLRAQSRVSEAALEKQWPTSKFAAASGKALVCDGYLPGTKVICSHLIKSSSATAR